MTERDAIERRLSAVERAVSGSDDDLSSLATAGERDQRLTAVEERLDALEESVTELEAATQALRGYVGNVRSVNRDVERRAEAALAAVDRLENGTTAGADDRSDGPTLPHQRPDEEASVDGDEPRAAAERNPPSTRSGVDADEAADPAGEIGSDGRTGSTEWAGSTGGDRSTGQAGSTGGDRSTGRAGSTGGDRSSGEAGSIDTTEPTEGTGPTGGTRSTIDDLDARPEMPVPGAENGTDPGERWSDPGSNGADSDGDERSNAAGVFDRVRDVL